jgi:hypothetical protein
MSNTVIENRLETIENKLDQKADKADIDRLDKRIDALENKLDHKADKADLERLEARLSIRMDEILNVLDKVVRELSIIRTEQKAISATLSLHEERIGRLEDKVFGQRVREQDEKYRKKRD